MVSIVAFVAICVLTAAAPAFGDPQLGVIDDAIVREAQPGLAPQITTAELRDLLARSAAVILDARPSEEFGMSHVPGAVNVSQKPGTPLSLYISDVAEVTRMVPDRHRQLVVYCNGPFCGKSRRFAEELVVAGYRNVRRYQLGMPGWRTMGGVAAIDAPAIRRIAELDGTAVFIDAGLVTGAPPVPAIVRLRPEEVTRAKDDGRLPMHDHNTRIVVLGATAAQARAVAEAIAANAFHNVAYYDGSGDLLNNLSGTQEASPNDDVLRAREAALAAGDVAAVMNVFADDAVVVTSSGRVLIGKEQVQVWVKDQVDRGQREHAGVRQTAGNKTSWAATVEREDWRKLGVSPLNVRQDAVVEVGKVRFFNTTLTLESAEKVRAARKKP